MPSYFHTSKKIVLRKGEIFLKKQFTKKEEFYMKIKDVIEWMQIADDDFDSAKILNESEWNYLLSLCQVNWKIFERFLSYNDIIPQKTHNLLFLNEICIETDNSFENIRTEWRVYWIDLPMRYVIHIRTKKM